MVRVRSRTCRPELFNGLTPNLRWCRSAPTQATFAAGSGLCTACRSGRRRPASASASSSPSSSMNGAARASFLSTVTRMCLGATVAPVSGTKTSFAEMGRPDPDRDEGRLLGGGVEVDGLHRADLGAVLGDRRRARASPAGPRWRSWIPLGRCCRRPDQQSIVRLPDPGGRGHPSLRCRHGVDARARSVGWNTSQGETTGKTVEKKTSDFTFDGQKFKPTDDDPYWIVESDKTGKQAAHKESSLRPRDTENKAGLRSSYTGGCGTVTICSPSASSPSAPGWRPRPCATTRPRA